MDAPLCHCQVGRLVTTTFVRSGPKIERGDGERGGPEGEGEGVWARKHASLPEREGRARRPTNTTDHRLSRDWIMEGEDDDDDDEE